MNEILLSPTRVVIISPPPFTRVFKSAYKLFTLRQKKSREKKIQYTELQKNYDLPVCHQEVQESVGKKKARLNLDPSYIFLV